MALEIGSRLGHYEVSALIGEGGMGQVYQATDTKLNRQVALKILPEAFAADPDRLARFQREAQVLASLSHPGIAQIHGIEEQDGTQALVLELVEGPTLADRIAQGPIPVDEALPIAKQIAEALEAAHEAGVVHRDLKPANIKVRGDGTAKVLDFGLAKALETTPESDPSESPTLTAAATQMGVIMGTAAYMSPEQARGSVVDKRADIWSFGCVLFEMLTGHRAFEGENLAETLAHVIDREPDWASLSDTVPPVLRLCLQRCLRRTPKDRLHDIADARLDMEDALEVGVVSSDVDSVLHPPAWQRALPLALAALLVGSLATGLMVWSLTRPTSPRLVRFSLSPDEAGPLRIARHSPDVAISRSGERIAYLTGGNEFGAERLHVRALDQLTSEIVAAQGELNSPFFAPDGLQIGFYDRRREDPVLMRVSALGGAAATICDLPGELRGASWGADDTIVFGTDSTASGLWRVAAVGGEPEQLTAPDRELGEVDHLWPEILPGGEHVLFTIRATEPQIAMLSLETGEQQAVLRGGSYPRYSPTGHLLYVRQGNLWAVPFDLGRLETVGDPVPVQENVRTKSLGAASVAVSDNGSLVYVGGGGARSTLVWVGRDGQEDRLPAEPRQYGGLRLSPDGRRAAIVVSEAEDSDIVVYDLARHTPTQLTFGPAVENFPVWTLDGQRVVLASQLGTEPANVHWKAADGTGEVERLSTSPNTQFPSSLSSDGQTLVIYTTRPDSSGDVAVLSMEGGQEEDLLIEEPALQLYAEVSRDGRWIAYQSTESGQAEIYVRPFPNVDEGKWVISRDVGFSPLWGPDGRELFYRGRAGEMMVVPIDTEPTFIAGTPDLLFEAEHLLVRGSRNARAFDISPDGQRFLMLTRPVLEDSILAPHINVVVNWHQELLERVPVN